MPCVETGSRIHLGFYSAGRGSWGALGLYVENPGFLVCSPRREGRTPRWIVRRLVVGGYEAEFSVERSIPRHVGLGSTTQGVLAAAHAVALASGRSFDPLEEAPRLGLGRISGTGILAYMYGGLVTGLGKDLRGRHRLLLRLVFPEDWRVVLVLPQGLRGLREREEGFMDSMEPPEPDLRAGMAEAAWIMLRGAARRELDLFLEGVRIMERSVGAYFSPYQGGAYRSDLSGLVERLREKGIVVGQSSWGPLLYTFAQEEEASRLARRIRSLCRSLDMRCRVWTTRARNRPASPVSE